MDVSQVLWEIEQIKQLRGRALRLFDARLFDAYLEQFTENCVLEVEGPHPARVINGRNELASALATLPEGTTMHYALMPEIALVDETHAHGTWAMIDRVALPGFGEFIGFGRYTDEYEKGVDGEWRFSQYRLTRGRIDDLSERA